MNNYFLTLLVKQDLDEKDRKELLEGVKKNFGKLTKEDLWGVRDLAYSIKHLEKAYYAHFEFESEPSKIPALDKSLKLNEDILRYLLLKVK
jgi:small subunit ribosomal protein S6